MRAGQDGATERVQEQGDGNNHQHELQNSLPCSECKVDQLQVLQDHCNFLPPSYPLPTPFLHLPNRAAHDHPVEGPQQQAPPPFLPAPHPVPASSPCNAWSSS